jgi:predicted DNA binding CopG/RHH family protein
MKGRIPNPDKMKRIKGPKLSPAELRSAKIRVTTFLDEDVLGALKEMAEKSGTRYQTLLNQLLRQSLIGGGGTILERLEKLEKAVFKKRAA